MHNSGGIRMSLIPQAAIVGNDYQAMRDRAPCLFRRLQPVAGFKHIFSVLNQSTAMHVVAFYRLLR